MWGPESAQRVEIEYYILVIKAMTLIFRDFVSKNEHFRMTFQQI